MSGTIQANQSLKRRFQLELVGERRNRNGLPVAVTDTPNKGDLHLAAEIAAEIDASRILLTLD